MRTVDGSDLSLSRPAGIAYDVQSQEFLVARSQGEEVAVHLIDRLWEPIATVRLPNGIDPSTLSVAAGGLVTWEQDGQTRAVPHRILRSRPVVPEEQVTAADPEAVASEPLAAFNPADGLIYTLDAESGRLDGYDADGDLLKSYDASSADLGSPEAMTFAPSSDGTDDPETQNLFVADSGDETWDGGVTELTLEQTLVSTASTTDTATLVQEIDTSAWTPPSTDPSGIVWRPSVDQLIVVDSEVEETNLFEDVNMWHIDRSGSILDTGATFGPASAGSYSDEPTGVGYDDATGTLFVSDDTGTRSVYVVDPGSDGSLGTTDDQVVQIDMEVYGATDTEDPELDPVSGHLFVLGGTDREIWRIDPVDGVFGNGNDSVTGIDISHLGPTDFEGLTSSSSRGTLFVGSRNTDQVFEIGHDGQLVRTIDVDVGNNFISGLAIAPSSADPSVLSLWIVDRKADEVNDGRIYEVDVPDLGEPIGNLPPVVEAGADQTIEYPDAVALSGSVTDDGRPEDGQLTHAWTKLDGPGVVTFGDASALSTTAEFSAAGIYTLELSASDGELSAGDSLVVTVQEPPNSPPTVDPISDVSVAEGETVVVPVSVSDPDGDELTITTDGLPAFASFDEIAQEITISPETGDAGLYGPVTVTVSDGDPDGGQAPVFRSASSAADTSAGGSQLVIDRPTDVQPGDLMVAQIRYRDDGGPPNLTAPPGWSEIGTIPQSRS
ncbi:MAG: PKD domain-containing protein, partial [Actinomycetota bacterium]